MFINKQAGIREENEMKYPIVIHKEKGSDYGVTVPDLEGCFSAGESYEEALSQAVEAIECRIEGMLLDGEIIPKTNPIEVHQKKKEYKNGVWALVDVDVSKFSGKAKRVNITLPERLLNQIDTYADSHGESRSGLLVHAAVEYISTHS